MNLKKYLTLTRAGIIEALQFRLSFLILVAGNLLYLIVTYFLWKAIYASVETDTVNGMTFTDTLIYLVLATALYGFLEMYLVWEIGRNIQSGKIVLDLLKPMPYRRYLFWSYSGSFVTQFFFTFLPTFIVVSVVTHGAIPLGINLVWFAVSVVLAVMINFSIDYIIGTVCLYTESIWGINIMKQVVVLLLVEVILLGQILAVDGAGHVEAGIANRLQLADLAQHGTDFALRLVAQVGVAHLLEELADFVLHVVAYLLVLLNALKEFLEFLGVFLLHHVAHHAVHAQHAPARRSSPCARRRDI